MKVWRFSTAANPLQTRTDWVLLLCFVALFAKIVILVMLAVNTRFVMDEFWHFSQSNYIFNGFFDTIWPKKAVGYAVYYKIAHGIGWDAESMLIAGRLLNVAISLVLLWVVMATTRALGRSRAEALLAVVILLCFSTFIERTFRLRSEPLAILFAATALMVVLRGSADKTSRLFVAGLFCGLAFITTQKSIYFNVALGMGLVIDALAIRSLRRALVRSAVLLSGWAIVILVYGLIFGGLDPMPVLHVLFFGPLDLAINGGDIYSGLHVFFKQTISRNACYYVLCFAGILLTLVRVRQLGPAGRVHLVHTLVISVLVFTHNQPWPYVFTMVFPFLVPYVPVVWSRLNRNPALGVLFLVVIVAPSFWRNVHYLAHDNREQRRVVTQAESLLKPGDTYFDGIAMVPTGDLSPWLWLDAMGVNEVLAAGQSSEMMRSLRKNPPEVIIESYRTNVLAPVLEDWVSASYVRVANNILVQGTLIVSGVPAMLIVLERQRFVAIRRDTGEMLETLQIEGEHVPLPIALEPGTYRIEDYGAGSSTIVVPVDKVMPTTDLPPQRTDIFNGIYKY